MTTATQSKTRIYVACLAAYNEGNLHGKWIDANQNEEEIMSDINLMLQESPIPNAEEWAIHDYEGFGDIELSEYEDIETVAELAEALEEHGDVFGIYYSLGHHNEILAHVEGFKESYRGCYDSLADYVQEYHEEGRHEIPAWLENYIDWDSMARDWEYSGKGTAVEVGYHEVHIFESY